MEAHYVPGIISLQSGRAAHSGTKPMIRK